MVVELNNNNFESEIKGDLPVLVDFWAAWCGPCRAQAPILERLDPLKVKVCKLNVDEFPLIAGKYGIQSIPTMLLFKNGVHVKTIIGLHTQKQLEEFLSVI